ncbi:hypothetical protein FRC08_015367 [Ceratobasidium sp. 394]|nr:hypothetical protein FRC08_015367 [Ceratobasidium sp. 394]
MSVFASAVKAGHEVLVIDSRGDLSIERLKTAIDTSTLDAERPITKKLHYTRATSLPELLSCISTLPQYCGDHPSVKLVILSHLSYHIQTSAIIPQTRAKILTQIKQSLIKMCASGQMAVVATTSMATKLVDDEGQPANFSTGTKALLMPSLGDTFSPGSKTYRIVLARQPYDGQRFARLLASPGRAHENRTADFQIKGGFLVGMDA